MEKKKETAVEETAIVKTESVFTNLAKMQDTLQMAEVLCKSQLIPQAFRDKPSDCLIALDLAYQTKLNPFFVMQNIYVVQGKPSWSGQACIALINSCGRFSSPLTFEFVKGQDGTRIAACRAKAINKATGEEQKGSWITAQMVHAAGWDSKSGSQWLFNAEQMYRYRAATFFGRVYCPDILMGMRTEGEIEDANAMAVSDRMQEAAADFCAEPEKEPEPQISDAQIVEPEPEKKQEPIPAPEMPKAAGYQIELEKAKRNLGIGKKPEYQNLDDIFGENA